MQAFSGIKLPGCQTETVTEVFQGHYNQQTTIQLINQPAKQSLINLINQPSNYQSLNQPININPKCAKLLLAAQCHTHEGASISQTGAHRFGDGWGSLGSAWHLKTDGPCFHEGENNVYTGLRAHHLSAMTNELPIPPKLACTAQWSQDYIVDYLQQTMVTDFATDINQTLTANSYDMWMQHWVYTFLLDHYPSPAHHTGVMKI